MKTQEKTGEQTIAEEKEKTAVSEITAAVNEFMVAFNIGDARTMARHYTGNARLYPPNSNVIEGPVAIGDFWNSVMSIGIKKCYWKP